MSKPRGPSTTPPTLPSASAPDQAIRMGFVPYETEDGRTQVELAKKAESK